MPSGESLSRPNQDHGSVDDPLASEDETPMREAHEPAMKDLSERASIVDAVGVPLYTVEKGRCSDCGRGTRLLYRHGPFLAWRRCSRCQKHLALGPGWRQTSGFSELRG